MSCKAQEKAASATDELVNGNMVHFTMVDRAGDVICGVEFGAGNGEHVGAAAETVGEKQDMRTPTRCEGERSNEIAPTVMPGAFGSDMVITGHLAG